MELEELRAKWQEHDLKLESSIRLNRQLLHDNYTGRAHSALCRFSAMVGLGAFGLAAVIAFLGAFIRKNLGEPRLAWTGVILDSFAVAALPGVIAQFGPGRQID